MTTNNSTDDKSVIQLLIKRLGHFQDGFEDMDLPRLEEIAFLMQELITRMARKALERS